MNLLGVARIAFLLGLGICAPALAQSPEAEGRARMAFEWGREAYDRGLFEEALKHFEYAYSLSGRAALLFNVARAADSDQQLEKAVRSYDAYLAAVPNADNRAFVEARLAKLRGVNVAPVAPVPAPQVAVQLTPTIAATEAAPPRPASEEVTDAPSPPSVGAPSFLGLRFNVGGHLATGKSYEAIDDEGYEYEDSKGDLSLAKGFQIGSTFMWPYVGVGAELRFTFLRGEADESNSYEDVMSMRFIDLVIKPQAAYVFGGLPLELYLALPCGVTMGSADYSGYYDDDYALSVIDRPGATVGFTAGASYLFTRYLGMNLEISEIGRWFTLERLSLPDTRYNLDAKFWQTQVALNLLLKV